MLRIIIWFIYFWIYMLVLLPKRFKINYLLKNENNQEASDIINSEVKKWARSLIKLAGGTVNISGLSNLPTDQPYVVVSNHQGNFDIPIMLGYVGPVRSIVSKIEISKLPFISWWMRQFNCFFVDRSNPRDGVKLINQAALYVKEGNCITVFPEGTRSKGPNMGEFRGGAFKIAKKAKVLIVPVTIDGSYNLMEVNRFKMTPASVNVTIHPPIPYDIEDISNCVQDIIKTAITSELV